MARLREHAVAAAQRGVEPLARSIFDSALKWVYGRTRHEWSMQMEPIRGGLPMATAQSHVFPAPHPKPGQLFRLLSRWNVDVYEQQVPNWVAAFMAALDEMEGQDEETDVDGNPSP